MVGFFKDLFVENTPIELLVEHGKILEQMNNDLETLISDYLSGKDISKKVREFSALESKADQIKFKIRKILSENIKTPYAITDILDYLSKQEYIVDLYEDIAKKISLNQIDDLDESAKEKLLALSSIIVESVNDLLKMIDMIPDIIQSSFSNRLTDKESEEVINLQEMESKVDKLNFELGKWIYSKKNSMNAIDLIFFRELIKLFVKISDNVENTAELLNAFLK